MKPGSPREEVGELLGRFRSERLRKSQQTPLQRNQELNKQKEGFSNAQNQNFINSGSIIGSNHGYSKKNNKVSGPGPIDKNGASRNMLEGAKSFFQNKTFYFHKSLNIPTFNESTFRDSFKHTHRRDHGPIIKGIEEGTPYFPNEMKKQIPSQIQTQQKQCIKTMYKRNYQTHVPTIYNVKNNKNEKKSLIEQTNYVPLKYPPFRLCEKLKMQEEEKLNQEKGQTEQKRVEDNDGNKVLHCINGVDNIKNKNIQEKLEKKMKTNESIKKEDNRKYTESGSIRQEREHIMKQDHTIKIEEKEKKEKLSVVNSNMTIKDFSNIENVMRDKKSFVKKQESFLNVEKGYDDKDRSFFRKNSYESEEVLSINPLKYTIPASEITNEIKFILHMTILTLYKDQIKPTYKKIKLRLKCFNENYNIRYNFINIYAALQKYYIVVRSDTNKVFVLLRETPKWFRGWVDVKSFANPYPKKVWRKFILYLLDLCRANRETNTNIDPIEDTKGKNSLIYDTTNFSLMESNKSNTEESQDVFNRIKETAHQEIRKSIENFKNYDKSSCKEILEGSERDKTSAERENQKCDNTNLENGEKQKEGRKIYEFQNDIYEVANDLKKLDLSFFREYSLGKIAHIIQLGLYHGILVEEDQKIKPACCARSIVSSVFYFPNEDNLENPNNSQGNQERVKKNNSNNSCIYNNMNNDNYNLFEENYESSFHLQCIYNSTQYNNIFVNPFYKEYQERGADLGYIYQNAVSIKKEQNYNDMTNLLNEHVIEKEEDPFYKKENSEIINEVNSCKEKKEYHTYERIYDLEEAKEKIDHLIRNSYNKQVYLCLFREKFLKKYKKALNPLVFGYNSLIEFLYYACKDICKIYVLNSTLVVVPADFVITEPGDKKKKKKKKKKEEEKEEKEKEEQPTYTPFSYSDYSYSYSEKEKEQNKKQNGSFINTTLELCTIMKDLCKKRNDNLITYKMWKNLSEYKKNKNVFY